MQGVETSVQPTKYIHARIPSVIEQRGELTTDEQRSQGSSNKGSSTQESEIVSGVLPYHTGVLALFEECKTELRPVKKKVSLLLQLNILIKVSLQKLRLLSTIMLFLKFT